jgi:hypothetical protein
MRREQFSRVVQGHPYSINQLGMIYNTATMQSKVR